MKNQYFHQRSMHSLRCSLAFIAACAASLLFIGDLGAAKDSAGKREQADGAARGGNNRLRVVKEMVGTASTYGFTRISQANARQGSSLEKKLIFTDAKNKNGEPVVSNVRGAPFLHSGNGLLDVAALPCAAGSCNPGNIEAQRGHSYPGTWSYWPITAVEATEMTVPRERRGTEVLSTQQASVANMWKVNLPFALNVDLSFDGGKTWLNPYAHPQDVQVLDASLALDPNSSEQHGHIVLDYQGHRFSLDTRTFASIIDQTRIRSQFTITPEVGEAGAAFAGTVQVRTGIQRVKNRMVKRYQANPGDVVDVTRMDSQGPGRMTMVAQTKDAVVDRAPGKPYARATKPKQFAVTRQVAFRGPAGELLSPERIAQETTNNGGIYEVYNVNLNRGPVTVETTAGYHLEPHQKDFLDRAAAALSEAPQAYVDALAVHTAQWSKMFQGERPLIAGRGHDVNAMQAFSDANAANAMQASNEVNAWNGIITQHPAAAGGERYRGMNFWDASLTLEHRMMMNPAAAQQQVAYNLGRVDLNRGNAWLNGPYPEALPLSARRAVAALNAQRAGQGLPPARFEDLPPEVQKFVGQRPGWMSGGDAETGAYTGAQYWRQNTLVKDPVARWEIDPSEEQSHRVADEIDALWKGYQLSGNIRHLANAAEYILGGAMSVQGLLHWNPELKKYQTLNRMGPNEFHEGVDDNFFTNVMFGRSLEVALRTYETLEAAAVNGDHGAEAALKRAKEKFDLSPERLAEWRKMIPEINVIVQNGLIAQHKTWFDLKELPQELVGIGRVDRHLKAQGKSPGDYQATKQPDALQAFYALRGAGVRKALEQRGIKFTDAGFLEFYAKNYLYYSRRDTHGSTLANGVLAQIACEIGPQLLRQVPELRRQAADLRAHNQAEQAAKLEEKSNEMDGMAQEILQQTWGSWKGALLADYVDSQREGAPNPLELGTVEDGTHLATQEFSSAVMLSGFMGFHFDGDTGVVHIDPVLPVLAERFGAKLLGNVKGFAFRQIHVRDAIIALHVATDGTVRFEVRGLKRGRTMAFSLAGQNAVQLSNGSYVFNSKHPPAGRPIRTRKQWSASVGLSVGS